VRAIYGPGRPAQEADVVALFGKTLGRAERPLGLNLNLGWTTPFSPLPGERPGRYFVNASVGQAVTPDTVLVLTYVREQQERGERNFQLVQAGIRHRLAAGGPVLLAWLARSRPQAQGLAASNGSASRRQWSSGVAWRAESPRQPSNPGPAPRSLRRARSRAKGPATVRRCTMGRRRTSCEARPGARRKRSYGRYLCPPRISRWAGTATTPV
jgi:hypothetical protein